MSFQAGSVYCPMPSVVRGKPVVLSGDPKNESIAYGNGKTIVVRNASDALNGYSYNEHIAKTTVAKWAPSGFYIASADESGKIRIWDTTQEEHILKCEYQPLGGPIKDLAWSPDSKRLVVCGEGRESFAHAFLVDTGSSVGQMACHSRAVNSIDFKQSRPFRVATASEDTDVGFYQGPPFKRDKILTEHSSFVNTVRFSPDGSKFATAGADGKSYIYEGKEATLIAELNGGSDSAHSAGIYGLSWSSDNNRLITASADKTVKMWDVAENKLITTFTFGQEVDDQQLGCLWLGDHLISVSLTGALNFLDIDNPSQPKEVYMGHVRPIRSLSTDGSRIISGSYDGRICSFSPDTAVPKALAQLNNSPAQSVLVGDKLTIACLDDTIWAGDVSSGLSSIFKCESTPQGLACLGDITVISCLGQIVVLTNNQATCTVATGNYEAKSASIAPGGNEVAIGCSDNKIRIFSLADGKLTESKELSTTGCVDAIAYSASGDYLASGDSGRNVYVFDVRDNYSLKMNRWKFHTARVNSVAWSPNGELLASASLDTNVIIWSMAKPMKRITIKAVHPMHDVKVVQWMSDDKIITGGDDACLRTFTITPHA